MVSAGKAGVHVVDISKPEAPTLITTIDTPAPAENATLDGAIGYLALGLGGMQIVDLKDPAKPVVVSSLESRDFLRRVIIKDYLAYLAERDAGIRIVNVADPARPVPLAVYNTYRWSLGYRPERQQHLRGRLPLWTACTALQSASRTIHPRRGRFTSNSSVDGVNVKIPSDVFESAVEYRHEPLPAINTPIGPEPTLVKVSSFFRNSAWIGEDAVKPVKPYSIMVKANTTGLTARQIDALSLYYWDTEIKRWRKDVSTRLDETTGILTATPSRLGIWGVFYDRDISYSNLPPTATPEIKP